MYDATQTLTDQSVLTVDYDQSLEAMIAAGRYDWTNPDITATWFPLEGTGAVAVEAKLFHFDRYISSDEAVAAITTADAENPWQPAQIEDLLSFGAAYPDEQRWYPILALGSRAKVDGHRRVPSLFRGSALRFLLLYWWSDGWDVSFRFLGVRKLPSVA